MITAVAIHRQLWSVTQAVHGAPENTINYE